MSDPRPRRVLIIQNDLRPRGGVETHVLDETRALRAAGYHVELFCLSMDLPEPPAPTTVYWRSPPSWRVRRLLAYTVDLRLMRALRRTLQRFQPDYVHAHALEQPFSLLPALRGWNVVHSVHTTALVCPISELAYRDTRQVCPGGIGAQCVQHRCVSAATVLPRLLHQRLHAALLRWTGAAITPPSQFVADRLAAHAALPRVTPLPLIVQPRYPPAVAREPDLVLFVGALVDGKGPRQLLDAVAHARRGGEPLRLVVVGEGPLRPALVQRAEQLGVADAVHFLGRLAPDDTAAWYRRAAVCVVPSLVGETFCLVAYEAMAQACPVIVAPRGALPEAVAHGDAGWIADPTDPVALADAICRVIHQPAAAVVARRGQQRAAALTDSRFVAQLSAIWAAQAR